MSTFTVVHYSIRVSPYWHIFRSTGQYYTVEYYSTVFLLIGASSGVKENTVQYSITILQYTILSFTPEDTPIRRNTYRLTYNSEVILNLLCYY